MYSVVESRISVLILSLNDGFPNRNGIGKFDKVNFDNWGSIWFRLIMGVHLLLRKKEQ